MKKILSFCLMLLFISGIAMAQQSQNKTPEERAESQTQKLTKELSLTSDQSTKIKASLLQQGQQADAIRTKYANATDKKPMHQEIKTLHESKDAEIKKVLTADQYTKYQTIISEQHEHHGDEHHHGGQQR
jgi:protein CpxP